ncbi:MAG: hypothetical protein IPJ33_00760 [Gammaproteobacteria bacterium]|nr:hypothetical protein [Gammaproteobacteria bacterium]
MEIALYHHLALSPSQKFTHRFDDEAKKGRTSSEAAMLSRRRPCQMGMRQLHLEVIVKQSLQHTGLRTIPCATDPQCSDVFGQCRLQRWTCNITRAIEPTLLV